jgi:hypothetical protein
MPFLLIEALKDKHHILGVGTVSSRCHRITPRVIVPTTKVVDLRTDHSEILFQSGSIRFRPRHQLHRRKTDYPPSESRR